MIQRKLLLLLALAALAPSPSDASPWPHVQVHSGAEFNSQAALGHTVNLGLVLADHWHLDFGWIRYLEIDDSGTDYFDPTKLSWMARGGYGIYLWGDWDTVGWSSQVGGLTGYKYLRHEYSHENYGYVRRAHAWQLAAFMDLGYRFAPHLSVNLRAQLGTDLMLDVERNDHWDGYVEMESLDRVQVFANFALALTF